MSSRIVLTIMVAALMSIAAEETYAGKHASQALLVEGRGQGGEFAIGAPIGDYKESTNRVGEARYESRDKRFVLSTNGSGRIVEIRTRSPQYFTQRLIQVGQSDMRAVLTAYGTPTRMERRGNAIALVYPAITFTIDDPSGSPLTGFERLLRSRVSEIAITGAESER